ncbi:hypothetical protein D3C76_1353680 [compost metagenome]
MAGLFFVHALRVCAHCLRNTGKASHGIRAVKLFDYRQQDGIADAVRQIVGCTRLVSQCVHQAKPGAVERHPRQILPIGHHFPRLQVFAVIYSGR